MNPYGERGHLARGRLHPADEIRLLAQSAFFRFIL